MKNSETITNGRRPGAGALITTRNNRKTIMPVFMEMTYGDESSERVNLPVEMWHRGNFWTVPLDSQQPVTRVVLNPDETLPDVDPGNRVWEAAEEEE